MNLLKDLDENAGREMIKVQNNFRKPPGNKRQKCGSDVVFVDDVDNCVVGNTKSVGIMWRKCRLKRNSGRESGQCYPEVKVPEGSTGELG